ncbi:4-hydroxybenzoate polyprenyltransferase [Flavobacteriales bacterium]|nr:putative 4-hydroxybenzoate polyprenyltransferase [Flavobacteriales bacterium]WKZ76020.1 MAG: UbiA-like polyprenyltransferase [Vicingaceae bacterium]GIK70461.1 MAG: 4-hydroxybenzoate octaprenyltransferase [Bacteroidota bacterium]CAG0980628.1 4-hydroxybenzoate polyprenyltransferase [Flavobacteriales bacterium]
MPKNKAGFSDYLSLVKFSHTLFALPFAFIGFFLALKTTSSSFDIKLLLLVIACMVFARSAAMAFNRYLDRNIDASNPRTANVREIPKGIISANNALWFVIINVCLFIASSWFINTMCFYLSPLALLVILGYSYTKRFTPLCHFVLGVGLALAPIGAYLAITAQFHFLPVLFSFLVLCWVSGFDIIYALQDEEFDREQKLYSIPVLLGKKKALRLSIGLHFLTAIGIIASGILGHFGALYYIGATLFIALLFYQHTLVKPNDLSKVNLAFFTSNGVASVVYSIFVTLDLYLN